METNNNTPVVDATNVNTSASEQSVQSVQEAAAEAALNERVGTTTTTTVVDTTATDATTAPVEDAFEDDEDAVVTTPAYTEPIDEPVPVVGNKADIEPVPCDRYVITSSQVIKYLQDQLGFNVGYDFTRWVGVSVDQSYVRMRVIFNPKDIVASISTSNYVDNLLAQNGAGVQFKDTVINALRPYMYPENIAYAQTTQEELDRRYIIGIVGDRWDEIVRFSKLTLNRKANLYRLYLRPERIIADMLSNPSTDKIDGNMKIIAVYGTTSDTIRWEVVVEKKGNSFTSPTALSMDQIFNNK